jgi:hypothetical protein
MQAGFSTAEEWTSWARDEHEQGRPARAEKGFLQALAIVPTYFPALFALASGLLDRGDTQGAKAIVGRMANIADDRPDVRWLQARLAVADAAPQAAREALELLLADTRLADVQKAEALLMLGLVLGDLGKDKKAFESAVQGKRLQHGIYSGQAGSRESEVSKLRRLATWLGAEPTRLKPWTSSEARAGSTSHIFLLGFPRSGTTLLEQVLAAHPRIITLEEAPTLGTAYQAFLSDTDACANLGRIGQEEADAWASHYWATVQSRGVNVSGRVFVDKQPAGTLYLPIIARLFPKARILFALRDPRDVVLSCFRQAFQINAMTYAFTDLNEAAACYDACMTFAERARDHLSLAWSDVRHEALVENFDAEVSRILTFLELEPAAAMTDFVVAAGARAIRTPSAVQVRAGLNRRGIGRWEQYRDELTPILPILAPWVTRWGYAP